MRKNSVHILKNAGQITYRITAGLFWALFCGLIFFVLSYISSRMTQALPRVFIRKRKRKRVSEWRHPAIKAPGKPGMADARS
jgi:hypothetical protein